MTVREILLKKISTYQFAMLDLQLFLNTHPGDSETAEQVETYRAMLKPLVDEYEKKYGALTKNAAEGNKWGWVKAPWPWESGEDC